MNHFIPDANCDEDNGYAIVLESIVERSVRLGGLLQNQSFRHYWIQQHGFGAHVRVIRRNLAHHWSLSSTSTS